MKQLVAAHVSLCVSAVNGYADNINVLSLQNLLHCHIVHATMAIIQKRNNTDHFEHFYDRLKVS